MIATATSSASVTVCNGELAAARSTPARDRPGTKSVCTADGEIPITLISGPSTRASETPITSIAALDAP